MTEYHFTAHLLNTFSGLTPWVQAVALLTIPATFGVVAHCIKEAVTARSHSRAAIGSFRAWLKEQARF